MWSPLNSIWTFPFSCFPWVYPSTPFTQLSPNPTMPSINPTLAQEQHNRIIVSETIQSKNDQNSLKSQKSQKISKKIKKFPKKDRFHVSKKIIIDCQFQKKVQKRYRNVPSNICKYLISHIFKLSEKTNLIQGQNFIVDDTKYLQMIQQIKKHLNPTQSYIRPRIIEQMCKEGGLIDQESSNTLCILVKNFLLSQLHEIVQNQQNMKKKQKLAYVRIAKKLLKQFCCS